MLPGVMQIVMDPCHRHCAYSGLDCGCVRLRFVLASVAPEAPPAGVKAVTLRREIDGVREAIALNLFSADDLLSVAHADRPPPPRMNLSGMSGFYGFEVVSVERAV